MLLLAVKLYHFIFRKHKVIVEVLLKLLSIFCIAKYALVYGKDMRNTATFR